MSYTITVNPSGRTFQAKPSQTILEAAIAAGINIPYECRNGTCGSCKSKLSAGKVMLEGYQQSVLSDSEKAEGWTLCCKALATEDLTIEVSELMVDETLVPKITPVRVEVLEELNNDVMKMIIKLPGSKTLKYKAGQYIEFLLPNGSRRAFSIANAPNESFLELHLRLIEGGKFTNFVFKEMKEKSIHRVEAPMGQFFLRESDRPIIFVAGGTGFAPIKSIIEDMIVKKISRPIYLYRGVRSHEDLYMNQLPEQWKTQLDIFTYVPVYSEIVDESNKLRTGFVHQAVLDDFKTLKDFQVYCSGAPVMVDIACNTFIQQGLPEDEFFSDAFSFAPPAK
jgi:CDP-4-dehydro-6-deoxyglucose reductase